MSSKVGWPESTAPRRLSPHGLACAIGKLRNELESVSAMDTRPGWHRPRLLRARAIEFLIHDELRYYDRDVMTIFDLHTGLLPTRGSQGGHVLVLWCEGR